jgi:hypothetical protein
MTIWRVAGIEEEPEVYLECWTIVEAAFADDTTSQHFVGQECSWSHCSGRVSSKIVEFDSDKKVGKTRSGRVYKLEGPSGYSKDGFYVWDQWCRINKVVGWKYVTGVENVKTDGTEPSP